MSGSLVNKLSFNAPVAPGAEVEVAVDLTAPQETGRYIGYWRLSTEDGCRFGQRMWVQIQVVTPGEEAAESVRLQDEVAPASMSIGQLKTKLAELGVDASSCIEKPELVALLQQTSGGVHKTMQEDAWQVAQDAAVASAQEVDLELQDSPMAAQAMDEEVSKQELNELKQQEEPTCLLQQEAGGDKQQWESEAEPQEAAMATQDKPAATGNEEAAAGKGKAFTWTSDLESYVEEAAGAQLPEEREAAAAQEAIALAAAEAAKQMEVAATISNSEEEDVVGGSDGEFVDVKGVLQKEALVTLANMGFEDTALSSALLEKTEGNVEEAALQLLNLKQWEQQQEDLREMGFCDGVENSLLLLKHAGRITQVVRDLVQSVEK